MGLVNLYMNPQEINKRIKDLDDWLKNLARMHLSNSKK
jgi:hypothetical protein